MVYEVDVGVGVAGAGLTAPPEVGPTAAGVVAGVGTNVIVLGTLVMIPGLALTWGAQMPAK